MQFPPDFQRAIQSFERFYLGRHQGRKITWRPEMGNVDVRIRFKARSHEVNMSTFAMVVLSLFEDLQKGEGLGYVVSAWPRSNRVKRASLVFGS